RRSSRRVGLAAQAARLLGLLQLHDQLLHVAVEDHLDVLEVLVDAVVGDAVLRVVVRADLLAAVAGADLALAQRRFGFFALAALVGGELRAQHVHRARAVLQLRALLAARHHDAAGFVRDADRRLGLVDVLTARTRRLERVDLQVRRADLDLAVVFDLGQPRHGRGRGVDAARRFGRGDALHA